MPSSVSFVMFPNYPLTAIIHGSEVLLGGTFNDVLIKKTSIV